MSNRIKDTYQKHLWLFLAVNIVIFWVISITGGFDIELANVKFAILITPKSLLFSISPIIVLILNGVISNPVKEFLVFWKIKNRLPGCRAFTELAKSDHRIDINSLSTKLGELPSDPSDQNRLWYKIYKPLADDKLIKGSHRDFLLTRDLCSMSFIFACIIITYTLIFWKHSHTLVIYNCLLLIQYIVISIASKNFANRFVCNVLTKI